MEDQTVVLTMKLADAICDMEDIAFGEGLGPEKDRTEDWEKLVAMAEHRAGRTCYRTDWSKRR